MPVRHFQSLLAFPHNKIPSTWHICWHSCIYIFCCWVFSGSAPVNPIFRSLKKRQFFDLPSCTLIWTFYSTKETFPLKLLCTLNYPLLKGFRLEPHSGFSFSMEWPRSLWGSVWTVSAGFADMKSRQCPRKQSLSALITAFPNLNCTFFFVTSLKLVLCNSHSAVSFFIYSVLVTSPVGHRSKGGTSATASPILRCME